MKKTKGTPPKIRKADDQHKMQHATVKEAVQKRITPDDHSSVIPGLDMNEIMHSLDMLKYALDYSEAIVDTVRLPLIVLNKRVKKNKYRPKNDKSLVKKQHELHMTSSDRISNTYMIDSTGVKREITSVSYECLINGDWVTIVYYDNDESHSDRLHVHYKISYQNLEYDAPQSKYVRQKGTVRRLNTWAVDDLKNNYLIYKRKFLKRSNLS